MSTVEGGYLQLTDRIAKLMAELEPDLMWISEYYGAFLDVDCRDESEPPLSLYNPALLLEVITHVRSRQEIYDVEQD